MDASLQRFANAVPPVPRESPQQAIPGPRGLSAKPDVAAQAVHLPTVFAATVRTGPARGLAWRGIPSLHFNTTPQPLSTPRLARNVHADGSLKSLWQRGMHDAHRSQSLWLTPRICALSMNGSGAFPSMPTIDEELAQLERDIRQLKIEYDQFFGGGRKRPPAEIEWRIDLFIKRYAERGGD